MEPISAVGIPAGTVTLVKLLSQGLLSVKNMLHGIRNVDESTRGFGGELDDFQFSLTIIDHELRKGTLIPEIQEWWNPMRLDALLNNATRTFSRLETIFGDIHRRGLMLQSLQEYYRTSRYDQEIKHLRLRIKTYTSSLSIPVVLLAIHGSHSPDTQTDPSLSHSLLGDKMLQLEKNIDSVSNDIRTSIASQATRDSSTPPEVESSMCTDSKELVDIARSLTLSASSVASIGLSQSTASTVRAFGLGASSDVPPTLNQENSSVPRQDSNEVRDDTSLSVTGVPITAPIQYRVNPWIQETRTSTNTSLHNDPSSAPSVASMSLAETSRPSSPQYTPPSTITTQGDMDIEIELAKRRYRTARDLMEKQKFREAIPHLMRTLDAVKGISEGPVFEDAPRCQEIQMHLITALTKNDPSCEEAEPILREVFMSPDSRPLEKFSAAHLLAQLLFILHPEDCTEAKKLCLTAIKGRTATSGRTDPNTHESIALLAFICKISNDSDEALWLQMLPDNYTLPKLVLTGWLWGAATGKPLYKLAGYSGHYNAIAFSPNGKVVALGCQDYTVRLWDATKGELLCQLKGHSSPVYTVAFSPDSKVVASSGTGPDFIIRLWSATKGELMRELKGHSNQVNEVALSPDGKLVASGSSDYTVRLWDTTTGELSRQLKGHSSSVFTVAFSPDSKVVASGGRSPDFTIRLWSATKGELMRELKGHSNHVYAVAFSPDGKMVASGGHDNTARLWDATTGELTRELKGHSDWVYTVAFSPDGKLVASGGRDRTIKLWDATNGELTHDLGASSDAVVRVTFSPDGKAIASFSQDGAVKLWDTTKGE